MVFQVAVVYYSLHGRLVTTANVVAEGARKVPARLCAQPNPSCRRGVPQQGLHSTGWAPGRLRAAGGRSMAVADRRGTGHALSAAALNLHAEGA